MGVAQEVTLCNVAGCERLATASLETRALCWDHFLVTCRARLDACAQLLEERPFRDGHAKLVWQFAVECVKGASELFKTANELDPQERAKLVEILLRVEEMSRRLRRCARKIAAIPILLRRHSTEYSWEEKTETRNISRHGASIKCQHTVAIEEILSVIRADTRREAKVRVIWRAQETGGPHEIGVEFLDYDNFWELDWPTEDFYQ